MGRREFHPCSQSPFFQRGGRHSTYSCKYSMIFFRLPSSIDFKLSNVRSGCPISRAKASCDKRASIQDRIGI